MIQYPTQKKTVGTLAKTSTAKRGMNLEDDLNQTNDVYLQRNIANIHKKPTPITVVKVDYPARAKAKIVEAYYKIASTTDYNGVYKGKAIDFEAKETQSKTSFALANIHPHQIEHMASIMRHGGIAFVILRFSSLDETYLVFIQDLMDFLQEETRKSIPLPWIQTHGHRIPYNLLIPIHYLKVLDETILKGASDER